MTASLLDAARAASQATLATSRGRRIPGGGGGAEEEEEEEEEDS